VIACAGLFALFQRSYFQRAAVTFDPPYPQRNADGDPIRAIYEGRTPCPVADCPRLKIGLVRYHDAKESAPTTYWLGVVGTQGNDRVVASRTWTTRRGVRGYPDAVVYELDANAALELRHYWRVNEDILLVLDQSMNPKVGNRLGLHAEPVRRAIWTEDFSVAAGCAAVFIAGEAGGSTSWRSRR
jgi:hypothetical protein